MADSLFDRFIKLTVALGEGVAAKYVGEKFVDEFGAPTKKAIAIKQAMVETEKRFKEKPETKDLAKAIFDDLTIDAIKIMEVILIFYDNPSRFDQVVQELKDVLAPELNQFIPDQINIAAKLYLELLQDELIASGDAELREKISTSMLVRMNKRQENTQSEQRLESESQTRNSSPKRVFDPDNLPPPSDSLPRRCEILPRNHFFVNRKKLLLEIGYRLLGQNTESPIAVITGTMRGVGKTQLALQFCYHFGNWFEGIHWIDAQQTIEAEVAGQGERMGLARLSEATTLLTQTLKAWQEAPNRLIILDNVDKPEILRKWLSQLSNLKILITSQYDIAGSGLVPEKAIFRVDELTEEHSIELFKNLAPRLEHVTDEKIKVVAAILGHLPLAIDIAGRYLNHRKDLTLEKYMELLNTASLDHSSLQGYFSQTDLSPTGHIPSLYDTFSLSWNELDETSDTQARDFFMFAGYLAPNTIIPKALFYAISDTKNDEDQEVVDRSIDRLQQVGLLRKDNALHPLLSMFAQIQAKNSNTLEILVERMSFISNQVLWNVGNFSDEENSIYSALNFEDIRQHLETIASTAKASPSLNTRGLWVSLGNYYYLDAIEYSSAKNAYLFALDEEENKNEGKEKDLIAELYNKIGRIHHILFENEDAIECYLQSIEIWGNKYGTDHPGISIFLINLGYVYKDLREFGLAHQYVSRAYQIDKNKNSYRDSARDLNSLGEIILAQHDLKNANRLFSRSIEIYRQMEEFSFEYAQSACNLGEVLRQQGDLKTAKNWLEYAIQVNKTVYNKKEHPNLANCIECLGAVFQDENNIEGAKDSYNNALTIYQKYFPPEHPRVRRLVELLEQLD
jgi:tetratricopeptide (TPR) repeat protein